MCRDGNLRIPSPTTGTRLSVPQHHRSAPFTDTRSIITFTLGFYLIKHSLNLRLKWRVSYHWTPLLLRHPSLRRRVSTRGSRQTFFWRVQDTKTKDRRGRRLQSRRLGFQRRSILGWQVL